MTPNEICREIVTRLQLDGGVCADQNYAGEWEVRARVNSPMNPVWDFADLNHVADAIRAVGDGMGFSISRTLTTKGGCTGHVWKFGGSQEDSHGPTEAEALTRALHAYLVANKIGEGHLQPPEPEEPWIDVSESVSTANLPRGGGLCDLKIEGDEVVKWCVWNPLCSRWEKRRFCRKPVSLNGSVKEWRYAK